LQRRAAEPPTVSELADILTMERSALGQTLHTLQKDRLVVLDRDKRDNRRRPVKLTQAGWRAVARGRPYWEKAHAKFARFFGDAPALADLRTTLRDIAENPGLADIFAARPN
jgi:DNA-binding MarR family transcriptional regulator